MTTEADQAAMERLKTLLLERWEPRRVRGQDHGIGITKGMRVPGQPKMN